MNAKQDFQVIKSQDESGVQRAHRIDALDVTEVDPAEFLRQVDEQVADFSQSQQRELGLKDASTEHWYDANPSEFTADQRANTTILHAGLTMAHDFFIQAAMRAVGYKTITIGTPDNEGLQLGREFGNRGQCNPTYYTVGNLVKYLKGLEASGVPHQDIIDNYLFVTIGSCGPCRFGTYVTEFRKAMRDAGFEGFRVLLMEQNKGVQQATGKELGLALNARFFSTMVKAVMLGDILNVLGYRIRPYELNEGETQATIERAKQRIAAALEADKGLMKALKITRKELAAIPVDRTQVKPKVAIIGEFWAMTTEGDGNYRMQQFLEKEGAEVDVQLAVSWPLYLLWAAKYDTKERMKLSTVDQAQNGTGGSKFALQNVNARKRILMLTLADKFVRGMFFVYSRALGLKDYHLPDMQEVADISHRYYDNRLRGGEGHMEVGKLIQNVLHQKANMTLSIKPFGCMPSSGVSDGVQSLITELHPNAIFLPIETNGDGAVNVYSRVQMQLFKAREAAQKEVDQVLEKAGISREAFAEKAGQIKKYGQALHKSRHQTACSAGNLAAEIVG